MWESASGEWASAPSPHFSDRNEALAHNERTLEAEYGLFDTPSETGALDMSEAAIRDRLQMVDYESLEGLVWEQQRLSNTPSEVEEMVAKNEPFYVYYGFNREATLDLDSPETQTAFLRGGCSTLAADLHKATGWPIIVHSSNTPGAWSGHVTVQTPDGAELDIAGRSSNPLGSFKADENWTREEVSLERLKELVDSRSKNLGDSLGLLERQLTSHMALELLKSEGFVTE